MRKMKQLSKIFAMTLVCLFCLTTFVQASGELQNWQSDQVYWGGDQVQYNGDSYTAKWWTKGDTPDKAVANPWDTPWEKTDGSTPEDPDTNVPEPTNPDNPDDPDDSGNQANVVYPDYSNVDVGVGIEWPKTVFTPFVDATAWPPFPLAEKTKELQIPYYNLGFIVSQSRDICKPTWGTYYSAEAGPLNDQIKKVRAMGGDVLVSFGGAANVPLHVSAPNVETLKEQYKRFIKAYGLTRIDFDIEGTWVNDTVSLKRNSKALKALQDELKAENYNLEIWFTLPVLPSGLTNDGLNVIKLALDEKVDIAGVNVMTMDYGDSVAPNPANKMGEYGIEAITNLKNQLQNLYSEYNISKTESELWNMVGTTPMIGLNDVTTETFNLQDARETLAFANSKGIGMISMWSINRDKSPNGNLSYVSTSESSIAQADYEFSSIFNAYNDTSLIDPSAGDNDDSNNGEDTNTPPSDNTWSATAIYVGGDTVTYKGKTYEAKWWTQGNDPSKEVNYAWETPWKLVE